MASLSSPASCFLQRPVADVDWSVKTEQAYKNSSLEYFSLIHMICGLQTF